MAGTSVIKAVPSHDLLSELRAFLAGATRSVKTNPLELARRALSLLKTLPATRDAVLEYFCTLFEGSVSKYMSETAAGQKTDQNHGTPSGITSQEDATISEIHDVLCNFVSSNPEAWAPIISAWALQLLGDISSRYPNISQLSMSAGLNDTLQLWMSCCATRSLLDIITQCLSCLMHSNIEDCINALLDTSVAHRPHFDWVVAHVGSCFPHTVITKVLSCGLKDFCQHVSADEGVKAPKLNSVVGILGHLAGSHFADIRTALLELFKWSLEPGGADEAPQRNATVPFLVQLASLSPVLLRALTTDVLQTLTPAMLPQLAMLAPDWCNYFGSREALEDLVIHLSLRCEKGGTQILKLLLDAASPEVKPENIEQSRTVQKCSRDLLELLLREIDIQLRSTEPGNCTIELLESLRKDLSMIKPLLLSRDMLRMQTAVRLLGLLGYHRQNVLVSSAAYLLQKATTDNQLAALVRLITGRIITVSPSSYSDLDASEGINCEYFAQAMEQAIWTTSCTLKLESSLAEQADPEQLWINIAKLLRWEKSGKSPYLRCGLVSRALLSNLSQAAQLLVSPPSIAAAHSLAAALQLLPLPTHDVLQLARATVSYFFICVTEPDPVKQQSGTEICCQLFSHMSVNSAPARVLALRQLVEESLFSTKYAYLFGAPLESGCPVQEDISLLDEHHKQGTTALVVQRRSSLFHTNNQTKAQPDPDACLSPDVVANNTCLLIEVIKACCANPNVAKAQDGNQLPVQHPISLEAVTSIALLLVELISPDVMYNGLPWPEEDFCKVTVERDLHIRRVFEERPLAWVLARFTAQHRPALCYCSVLLRALTATLLSQWSGSGGTEVRRPAIIATTVRLLELMSLGQLLPPPLSALGDVVTRVRSHEVVQLLRDCVWNYMRDQVPSPALFTQDSTGLMWRDPTLSTPGPQYTSTLRFIIQSNIEQLGSLHAQLFHTTSQEE
ncbi:integrator complex subunit 5 isoform X1 [Schistocerca serialis cubense]|uniref:integrator complex subunit 5 isoform X1 n=2 Tax=Schistocerca serialis cubense TaxID=2023355 RepID=UPI00214E93CB|nr:integrator complex subunit 5 isoform X1 [Schistocerca serialis cubense]